MENIIEQLRDLMQQLSPENQRRVLDYAQTLARADQSVTLLSSPLPPSISGAELLVRIQNSKLSAEDVDAMERALEDCERI